MVFFGLSRESGPTSVAAFVPDLMDRSRIEIAACQAGIDVEFVTRPGDLTGLAGGGTRLVIIDLSQAGVLDVLPDLGPVHTVGFASHVDKDLLEAARNAGCDEVLARSALFRRLTHVAESG